MSGYPSRPGYVKGSDTSAAAAGSLREPDLATLRGAIYSFIAGSPRGATCDEIEVALNLRHQTASARLRELQLSGWVLTNKDIRRTRSARWAHVYYVARMVTRVVGDFW